MDASHRPARRSLATPTCSFKLYGEPVPDRAVRAVRGLASAWIDGATAGFVLPHDGSRMLSVHWWEAGALRRMRCDPYAEPGLRPDMDFFTIGSLDDWPVLSFEAESWARHVVRGRPPSLSAYLSEFYR